MHSGNAPWRHSLLRVFYACCEQAEIEGGEQNGSVDIHSIRGTFVSLSFDGGADPKAVQETVGHSTLQMTMADDDERLCQDDRSGEAEGDRCPAVCFSERS